MRISLVKLYLSERNFAKYLLCRPSSYRNPSRICNTNQLTGFDLMGAFRIFFEALKNVPKKNFGPCFPFRRRFLSETGEELISQKYLLSLAHCSKLLRPISTQRCIQNPIEHLPCSFFAKIVKGCVRYIFASLFFMSKRKHL